MRISKTIKDIQWAFISLITSSGVHFLLRIVLGRELGAYGLGVYTLVFAIYLLGMQLSGFGIGAALTKYVAEHNQNQKKIKELASSGLIGSFLTGCIMGLVLYLLSSVIAVNFFHNPDMVYLLQITALCFPFIAIQKTVIGTLNGLRKMKIYALVNIAQNISVFLVSTVLVIFIRTGIKGAVFGFVLPTIFVGLISLFFIKKFLELPSTLFNTVLKQLSWFGIYVVLINSINQINTQISSLLLGYFMNEVNVGYYAVSLILIQGVTLIPSAIQTITTPMVATYHGKNDYENIRKLIKKAVFKTLLITLFLSVLLAIFSEFLISIFFTKEFLPAHTPLLILILGYTAYAPLVSVGAVLSSIGKINIAFKIAVFTVVINTILNILFISKFGIVGAATATSLSLIINIIVYVILYKRYIFNVNIHT